MIGIGPNFALKSIVANISGVLQSGASLDFDFSTASANPKVGNATLTCTRAGTTATRVNSAGLIETVAANDLRFDHDPNTLACKGLLIEEERANLLVYSEQFDNAAHQKTNVTVSTNSTTAPDGNPTADTLTRSTGVSAYVGDYLSGSSGVYTQSIYAKAATTGNYFALRIQGTYPNRADVIFNLSNGTISSAAVAVGTASGASATIKSAGNGWYRCTLTVTLADSLTVAIFGPCNSTASVLTWEASSSVASDAYVWGHGLELGAFSTSYIPTTNVAVTRSSDQIWFNFAPIYSQTEGTLFIQFDTTNVSSAGRIVSIDDGAVTSNSFDITVTALSKIAIEGITGGVFVGSVIGSPTITTNTAVNIAARYSTSTTDAISVNGTTAVTGNVSLPGPGLTTVRLGHQSNGTFLNGHIYKFRIYNGLIATTDLVNIAA